MPKPDENADWLGDLRWQGYPRLAPVRDVAAKADELPAPRPRKDADARTENIVRENEALRAKIDLLVRHTADFERRLSDAGAAYEGAALEADSARRSAELERERLLGELSSLKSELARRETREATRESELALERERRADAEKNLIEARRRLNDLEAELLRARGRGAELSGSIAELRRQADASHERLLQAKALTDQDVQILRQEMREFLANFHRIQETFAEPPPGDPK